MSSGSSVYTLADLRDWRAVTAGVRPPLRLAVFGDPVAHSASPPMHNAALAACGIDLRYTRIHVRPDELAEALALIARLGFVGVNLTIPHKLAALPLLGKVGSHAAALGAVNTVRVEADGSLRGFNTDGPGFVHAVRAEFGLELHGARVLILGAAGGAGRALAAQCIIECCRSVVLVNRTTEKAQRVAAELVEYFANPPCELRVVPWDQASSVELLTNVDLVVNASSVGLGNDDCSPLPSAAIPAGLLVFDTVYRASGGPTPLIVAAQQARAVTAGGLSLLLHQGALSFEHWFDMAPPIEAMRRGMAGA